MKDSTLYHQRCYKLAKKKGLNSLKELILYLKNNPSVFTGEYDLSRKEMLEIAKDAEWTYKNDVAIKQSFAK